VRSEVRREGRKKEKREKRGDERNTHGLLLFCVVWPATSAQPLEP